MEATKFTLASGEEIMLTLEDVKALKPQIDTALAGLEETIYNDLKWRNREEVSQRLQALTDEKLLELAKLNDKLFKGGEKDRTLTQRIRMELFKRNGIGHKQLTAHLSATQRNFLTSLGLDERLFRR